jgi:hypothetical protein
MVPVSGGHWSILLLGRGVADDDEAVNVGIAGVNKVDSNFPETVV